MDIVGGSVVLVAVGSVANVNLACTDAGASQALNSAAVSARLWNTSTTDDVCISLASAPDYGTPKQCEAILEAWGGNGSANLVYETPSSMAIGAQTVYCDMAAGKSATVVITEYRQ